MAKTFEYPSGKTFTLHTWARRQMERVGRKLFVFEGRPEGYRAQHRA